MTKIHHPDNKRQRKLIEEKKKLVKTKKDHIGKVRRVIKDSILEKETSDELKEVLQGS